ncbi:hypothetical protein EAE96_008991 [Botrytis aclada]|nr:hypothetical protein EAE96_008991 [Botrytis aclada]
MGFRPSPARSSVCVLLTEPQLSEIVIHLTFASSSIRWAIRALRNTISHHMLSNSRFQQSISKTLKIVPRKHELHPWKFINIELNFEGAEYIPSIDETLKDFLRDFACSLGHFEDCPVSVGTSRFLPDSSSFVRGLVNHDELLHYIPRPRKFNGYSTRQSHSTEISNANSTTCSKADAKIMQYFSIGLRLSGIKLPEDSLEPSTSAQASSLYSTPNDGSREKPNKQSAFSGLSKELNKQYQQQKADDQTMQYQQIRKMQMMLYHQITTHMTTTMKDEPIETTNSSSDSDEGGVSIYIKPTPDCLEGVKDWAEQVETERQDIKKKSCSYPLQNNNSGTIIEWPWVQTELHGALQRNAMAQSHTLEAEPRSDSEEVTSFNSERIPTKASPEQSASTGLGSVTSFETPCNAPFAADAKESTSSISECLPHLRGGDASNRNSFKEYLKKITERILYHNFQHDIDLGYGGTSFCAEPFPEHDPTVDLTYLSDCIYQTDTRYSIRSNDPHAELIAKLNPRVFTQDNQLDSSSDESISEYHYQFTKNLDISKNSAYLYTSLQMNDMQFRGRIKTRAEGFSVNSPSKLARATHKRDKFRAMVEIPLKSFKAKFCDKDKKQPRNKQIELGDKYEGSEEIGDEFKRPLKIVKEEKSEKERESLEANFVTCERHPALFGANEDPYLRNKYHYPWPDSNNNLEFAANMKGLEPDSSVIRELLSGDCAEEYHSRSRVNESELIDTHELRFEKKNRKKEDRLDVETSYRPITHSILEAKPAKGIIHRIRNLIRIAQSQLLCGSSSDPKPHGSTTIYLTNGTQLRGGSGNESEANFFKKNKLRFARLLKNRPENEEAIAEPAPPATENDIPGTEDGLQRHHRDDSGVSGVGDEQNRDKDESVQEETPRQVVNLSEEGAETVETVREVDSDTSEERENTAHVEHVENVEANESSKPSEPGSFSRQRPGRQHKENETDHEAEREAENETQRRFRNELLDILWRFLSLKEEIWFKRNAIIHGAPSSKKNFELQLTTDEVNDIRQYVQNSCEMVDLSNEPRDAVTVPDLIIRANNHLLRARRVREIFDNWYAREGHQQCQTISSSNAGEGPSNIEEPTPVTARGAGVLDKWPSAAEPSENFRRDRNASETGADIARTSSDTQLSRRRSSLILAPLPDLFPAPYPGQVFRGETRGESSRSGAGGNEGSSITEKIEVLRVKNNISSRSSPYASSISTIEATDDNEATQGGMPNCHEQNEDYVYQEPIPEETVERLRDLGASRVEAVNLLNATAGNVDRATEVLQDENPLEQEDMRNLLVDPENDLHQVVVVTGVPPRRAFLALLVSESNVGGAIDLLTGEAIGATMNDEVPIDEVPIDEVPIDEVPIDEVISEEDSGNGSIENGSSGNETKKDGQGERCEKSSSEGSDVEVAETSAGFVPLPHETEDNEGGDESREGKSEGADVDAAESNEEYQPLIDNTENNDENDVHDDENSIDNDGHADTDGNENNRAGEAPTIELEMVFTSRKGKERAEGYNL